MSSRGFPSRIWQRHRATRKIYEDIGPSVLAAHMLVFKTAAAASHRRECTLGITLEVVACVFDKSHRAENTNVTTKTDHMVARYSISYIAWHLSPACVCSSPFHLSQYRQRHMSFIELMSLCRSNIKGLEERPVHMNSETHPLVTWSAF